QAGSGRSATDAELGRDDRQGLDQPAGGAAQSRRPGRGALCRLQPRDRDLSGIWFPFRSKGQSCERTLLLVQPAETRSDRACFAFAYLPRIVGAKSHARPPMAPDNGRMEPQTSRPNQAAPIK